MPVVVAAGIAALWEFCLWVAGRFAIKKVWEVVAAAGVGGVAFIVKGEAWQAIKIFFEEEGAEIRRRFNRVVYEMVKDDVGLELDPDNPMGSGSLTRAISGKVGIPMRDITDKEGTIEDLEAYSLTQIEARSGYRLNSLRDKEIIKRDMQRIASQILVEKTGIPITNFESPEAIKDDVLVWAEAKVAERIAANIGEADLIKNEFGVSVRQQLADLSGKQISAKNLLEGAKNAMLLASVRVNQRAQRATVPDRRTLQNREAQRRFRLKHGNRMKYVSLRENPARIGPQVSATKPVVLKKVERPIRRNALGIPIRGGG